jgi:cellulose synthase/poly-beta-1,6-N-acetylglucosamine synthase-like glycosyltransferase
VSVTVLVPTFHRPALLNLALASLNGQMAHEVLVCDGAKGQSNALNVGLKQATGEFITVMQDDDTVLPDGLHVMHEALSSAPLTVGAVYSLPQYTDADGVYLEGPPRLREYMAAHPIVTWEDVQRDGLFVHGTATMYRTEALRSIGGWDGQLHTAEEYDLHLRLLHWGWEFQAVDAVTVTYRKHPGGKSQNRKRRRFLRLGVMERIYRKVGL